VSSQVTEIIAAIRQAAAERPDHVYVKSWMRSCQYVDRNGEAHAGCLVGQGLWRKGIIGSSFIDAAANRMGIESLMSYLDFVPTRPQRVWLVRVQDRQDIGRPWGEAVRLADEDVLAQFSSYPSGYPPEWLREELAMQTVAVVS
jgi:hypothetical protein